MTKSFPKIWVFIILFEIILACVTLYITWSGWLSLELFLAIAAIGITVFITCRQEIQLLKITDIGIQTNSLTLKQQSDSSIRANRDSFFSYNRVIYSGKKFTIVFPVLDQQKPLPLLNQGDFYAIHIITSRIPENFVDLVQIPDSLPEKDIPPIDDTNPIIYICAPQANKALNRLYRFKAIHDNSDCEELKKGNWPMDTLKLPCWFIEDCRDQLWPIRSIYIQDSIIPESKPTILKSPAEDLYKEAKNHKEGFHHPKSIHDYAIFGRITLENETKSQRFILAGIHQYGTWIVAKLLRNIINNNKEDLDFRAVYLSNNDFIAVIEGEFNFKTLDIADNDIKVLFNYFWIKKDGKWKKAD